MTRTDGDVTVDAVKPRGFVIAAVLLATGCSTTSAGAQPSRTLVPADGSGPAAGICEQFTGHVVTVRMTADVPMPRCAKVRGGQELRVVDATRKALTVQWRPWAAVRLKPGRSVTFREPFARYLAKGMHEITASGVTTIELVYGSQKQLATSAG